jgi:hypothetical protein
MTLMRISRAWPEVNRQRLTAWGRAGQTSCPRRPPRTPRPPSPKPSGSDQPSDADRPRPSRRPQRQPQPGGVPRACRQSSSAPLAIGLTFLHPAGDQAADGHAHQPEDRLPIDATVTRAGGVALLNRPLRRAPVQWPGEDDRRRLLVRRSRGCGRSPALPPHSPQLHVAMVTEQPRACHAGSEGPPTSELALRLVDANSAPGDLVNVLRSQLRAYARE